VIMLLSFLPVFALSGLEGKMFHPLAYAKSFALLTVGVLAITLVPALCTLFIRGRLRRDSDSWVVRGVTQVYRPVLDYCLDRPAPLAWFVGVTFIVGFAPVGDRRVLLAALLLALGACWAAARRPWSRALGVVSLILVALFAEQRME